MPIPHTKRRAVRESERTRIHRTLQGWIVDGTLKPNERINDHEVAEYFAVSRTPVREALQSLAEEGLVRVEPSRGTRVAPVDETMACPIYEALAALSGCAARLACQKRKAGDIERLRQLNEDFREAVASDRHGDLSALDNRFHEALLDMADNPHVADMTRMLTVHANRYENLYFTRGADRMESFQEHEALIAAIEAGDVERSGRCAEENWLGFYRRRLVKVL